MLRPLYERADRDLPKNVSVVLAGWRKSIQDKLDAEDAATIAASNPQIADRFKGLQPAQVERQKSNLADFICDATGGPCAYLGRDMKTTHTGMKLTDADWNACVDSLGSALDKNKVPVKEKTELLGALGPLMKDIVGTDRRGDHPGVRPAERRAVAARGDR